MTIPLGFTVTYAVVTETSDTDLAIPGRPLFQVTGQRSEATGYIEPVKPVAPELLLFSLRQPVFEKGEILLLGPDGREFAAPGRKPEKWGVTIEEFATVEEAVARATEVLTP